MKHIFFIFFAFVPFISKAQGSITMLDKPFNISLAKDSEILNPLKRTPAFNGLSTREQDVVYWVNVARLNPTKFYSDYIVPFVQQFPEAKGRAFNSLDKDINAAKGLKALEPMEMLNSVAVGHAKEIVSGKTGFTHAAAGGKSFEQRMREAGISSCAAENLYEGKDDALVAVILLLIDKDVSGYGHRKVILHPMFNTVGVSFLPSRTGNFILVQDFSCK